MIESSFTEISENNSGYTARFIELSDYQLVFQLQEKISQKLANSKNVVILGCEHQDVITLGRRAEPTEVFQNGILPVVRSTRGGLATIHSRGQLVIYPLFNLREHDISVKKYVTLLLETTQKLLQLYGISSKLDLQKVGLYTSVGKIAFCGIEIKNHVCLHGISLNVSNDLHLFQLISACGQQNSTMDRLQNHSSRQLDLCVLFGQWSSLFKTQLKLN